MHTGEVSDLRAAGMSRFARTLDHGMVLLSTTFHEAEVCSTELAVEPVVLFSFLQRSQRRAMLTLAVVDGVSMRFTVFCHFFNFTRRAGVVCLVAGVYAPLSSRQSLRSFILTLTLVHGRSKARFTVA